MAYNIEMQDYYHWEIPNFGVFQLNLEQAGDLVARILCLEGRLDIDPPRDVDDYSLNMPELNRLLEKQIQFYTSMISAGVQKGTLKAASMSREIDDTIIPDDTLVDAWVLAEWLEERNTDIRGDWFEDYVEGEFRVSEAAEKAARLERKRIKEDWKGDENLSQEEKIASLESEVLGLQKLLLSRTPPPKAVKPLHTKERETLLKLIIGMAVDGYG